MLIYDLYMRDKDSLRASIQNMVDMNLMETKMFIRSNANDRDLIRQLDWLLLRVDRNCTVCIPSGKDYFDAIKQLQFTLRAWFRKWNGKRSDVQINLLTRGSEDCGPDVSSLAVSVAPVFDDTDVVMDGGSHVQQTTISATSAK